MLLLLAAAAAVEGILTKVYQFPLFMYLSLPFFFFLSLPLYPYDLS